MKSKQINKKNTSKKKNILKVSVKIPEQIEVENEQLYEIVATSTKEVIGKKLNCALMKWDFLTKDDLT